MKKRFICLVLALLLCLPASTAYSAASDNSISTLKFGEYDVAGKCGDTIYFKKSSYDNKFCGISNTQKAKATVYKDTVAGKVLVSDGWIYYSNYSDSKTYRIKSNGTGKKKLADMKLDISKIDGGYLYYFNSDDNTLYRMKTDGSGVKKIVAAEKFNISGGWVYYANPDDDKKLYKIKADGTGKKKMSDTRVSSLVEVNGDYLYFKSDLGYLTKIKINGSGEKVLADMSVGFVMFDGDWIYYTYYSYNYWTGITTYGSLYRVKKDGTGNQLISDDSVYSLNYIGNGWIYYQNAAIQTYSYNTTNITSYAYKVKTDGSSKKAINMVVYGEANGYLYYTDVRDSKFYRQNTKTQKSEKISDNLVSNLIFNKDKVYYCDSMSDNFLYKLTKDGKEKRVADVPVSVAYITNKYIVFNMPGDSKGLYCMKTDGTGLKKILDEDYYELLTVAGDWIYYSDIDMKFTRISPDGKKKQILFKADIFADKVVDLTVANGYLYYYAGHHEIYRMKEGSTDKELVVKDANEIMFKYGDYICFQSYPQAWNLLNVKTGKIEENIVRSENYLYCRGIYDGKLFCYSTDYSINKTTFYEVDLDSLGVKEYDTIANSDNFNDYSDGWVYSFSQLSDQSTQLTRTNLADGSTEKVAKNCGSFKVIDNWLFYRTSFNIYKVDFVKKKLD